MAPKAKPVIDRLGYLVGKCPTTQVVKTWYAVIETEHGGSWQVGPDCCTIATAEWVISGLTNRRQNNCRVVVYQTTVRELGETERGT